MSNSVPVAVLISDIHYNIASISMADASLKQAVKMSEHLGIPLIIAGDMHDTKALARGECLKAMMSTLKVGPTRRIVLPGNHCMINERSKEHSLEFLRDRCEIIDKPVFDKDTGFWLIPYQYDPKEMEEILSNIPQGSTIICHQGITGSYGGHYIHDKSAVDKEIFADFRTISGHYHRRQDIKCGRPRKGAVGLFSYLGNPYSLTFGEAEDGPKGFSVLNDDGSLTFVPTNLRKHVIINATTGSDVVCGVVNKDDLVWLKITGPKSELDKVNKQTLGTKLFGHSNFKLDLIPTDSVKVEKMESLTDHEILDALIEASGETTIQKVYLKKLWRSLL